METLQTMSLVYKLAIVSLVLAGFFRLFLGELLSGLIRNLKGTPRKVATVTLYTFTAYLTLSILAAPVYFCYQLLFGA